MDIGLIPEILRKLRNNRANACARPEPGSLAGGCLEARQSRALFFADIGVTPDPGDAMPGFNKAQSFHETSAGFSELFDATRSEGTNND